MSQFEQRARESAGSWLSRLTQAPTKGLSLAEQRLRTHYLADARRLVQREQQKTRWDRHK
jgi:hypothetical protein